MKVHFIGIAGVGMSATALLMKEAGGEISGSDDAGVYGPPVGILERAAIPFARGYAPENIPAAADCFVIGRNAKLAPAENAEVRAALESGKPHYSFPEMLGQITQGRHTIVVAGSYGKSTTDSLIAHILRHAGVDSGYFIGAEPVRTRWIPAPAALGSAKEFVLEGDEYPSAHDDSRAKFLHLHPCDLVLTSVVHDHVNVYPTFADYQKPFRELAALVPAAGTIFVCADEPGALALAKESGKKVVSYAVNNPEADYRAGDIRYGARTRFALLKGAETQGELETELLGAHNVENIVAASAVALSRGIPFEKVAAAVADFRGVRRRLDNVAPTAKIPVFEGFGSSYEKARSAIEAMRLHFPTMPLAIIFEPHTFGWRNRANLSWYDDVFMGASRVFVAPPESQGAATHAQLTHEEILERVRASGIAAEPYEGAETAARLSPDEAVLILTSGDLEGTLPPLLAAIEKRFA